MIPGRNYCLAVYKAALYMDDPVLGMVKRQMTSGFGIVLLSIKGS